MQYKNAPADSGAFLFRNLDGFAEEWRAEVLTSPLDNQ